MRVLIVGSQRFSWMAPSWARGLRTLGLEVIEWDWTPFYSRGLLGRIEQRFLIGPGISRANAALLRAFQHCQPDVALLYAASPIQPATIKTLAQRCWVTGYHNDDPFGRLGRRAYFRYWKQALPLFHSHHVFRPQNVLDYQRAGVKRLAVLLPFYIPWLDAPGCLTDEDRQLYLNDIVFVGHGESDNRIAYIEAILSAGLPLRLYGGEEIWRRHLTRSIWNRLRPIRPVEGLDYRKAIAGAKICLGFFSEANRDECTFRVFEIPAVGAFLLAERTPTMQQLYREGEEIELFSTPRELVDKCCYYLAHETERQRIALAGRKRCISSGYDVISRMQEWLTDIEKWKHGTGSGR